MAASNENARLHRADRARAFFERGRIIMNQVNELRKGRRNLASHRIQERHAVEASHYRGMLHLVACEPGSKWMDEGCRRSSLHWLAFHTIQEDRAHRSARGYPDAR